MSKTSDKNNAKMSPKRTAIIVGILILVAYSMLSAAIIKTRWLVTLFDVISGLAMIGAAVLMFPFFKISSRKLSFGYLYLKILEGALMIAAGIFFLSDSLQGWRGWIYDYPQTYEFIISASLFYILLFKTKLVPRFISVWGLIACCALLMASVVGLLGVNSPMVAVLTIPIITNEVFLAIWLMIKGFNLPEKA
jgi:hypothetical protein